MKQRFRRRNPQSYRIHSAIYHYRTWGDEARLIEKLGNLAGRILAINKVLMTDYGKEILAPSLREALITLYTQLVPEERLERYDLRRHFVPAQLTEEEQRDRDS